MAISKKRIVVSESRCFTLVRQERPDKKTWFEIKVDEWKIGSNTWEDSEAIIAEISTMFETNGAQKQPRNFVWFFWKYDDAFAAFTMATLKYT
jgi:hypothetical protein